MVGPARIAKPEAATAAAPAHICYLCRRKLPSAEALLRHERQSELHRRSLDKQDELVAQHKQEVLANVHSLRKQLNDAVIDPSRCAALEGQLRQLLGEYGMAQEMLEHSRTLRGNGGGGGSRAAGATCRRQPTSHEIRVGNLVLDLGAACWQGGKEVQEDRYVLDLDLRSPEGHAVAGFCVLDGHSGSRCVDFLTERLAGQLQACLSAMPSLTEDNLGQAVLEACAKLDSDFLISARKGEFMDGSTFILGLLFPEVGPNGGASPSQRPAGSCRLLVANVGDSRAVLCRATGAEGKDGKQRLGSLRLSEDHKPDRPDEQQRIQAKGGSIAHHGVWRVFVPGQVYFGGRSFPRWGLAVSRAFGDLLLKEPERYGCSGVAPGGLVIAEPELRTAELDPAADRFLILACDGIWDVLRDEDAVAVCAGQAGAELAAHSLVRHAFAAGSGDNLTALVVAWRPAD